MRSLFSLSFLFCSIVCVLFFVLRVKTDDLSLSLFTSTQTKTEWTRENEEKEDVAQWENDWDDTEETDDFKTHLREELKKNAIRK